LAEFVAADLMRLKTEIDKLATYAAEKKVIARADVSALVISEKTTTVWELADLLHRGSRKGRWNFWIGCCAMAKSRCRCWAPWRGCTAAH